MKSKREETPGCWTYGFGQTEGQILSSRVSNHTPPGTALHLLVNLLSLLCAGREGVVASPAFSPTAGASTDPVPPLPAGTKVWAYPYGSAFIDRSGTRRFPMRYVSHCEESVNGLSLCSRVQRESQPIWMPSLAHACQLSRDGSLPQVFQSSLIISTLSNNNKLILTPLGQTRCICDSGLIKPKPKSQQPCFPLLPPSAPQDTGWPAQDFSTAWKQN